MPGDHPQRSPEAREQPRAHRPEAAVEEGDDEAEGAGQAEAGGERRERGFLVALARRRRLRACGLRRRASGVSPCAGSYSSARKPRRLRPCALRRIPRCASFGGQFGLRVAGDEAVGGFVGDADRERGGGGEEERRRDDEADQLRADAVAAGLRPRGRGRRAAAPAAGRRAPASAPERTTEPPWSWASRRKSASPSPLTLSGLRDDQEDDRDDAGEAHGNRPALLPGPELGPALRHSYPLSWK